MLNPNKPAGLSFVQTLSGSDATGKGRQYYIAQADANPYYPGDLVTLTGTGDANRGIPGITLATAGAVAVGVFVAGGVFPDGAGYVDPNNLNRAFIPAAKTQPYYALIIDDPNAIFEIQDNSNGANNLSATSIGENANIIYSAPQGGALVSGTMLDVTTPATTATLNLKILGLVRRVDNAFGQYAKWNVMINNHVFRGGVTGV